MCMQCVFEKHACTLLIQKKRDNGLLSDSGDDPQNTLQPLFDLHPKAQSNVPVRSTICACLLNCVLDVWTGLSLLIASVACISLACRSGTVVAGQLRNCRRSQSATLDPLLPLSAALPGAETGARECRLFRETHSICFHGTTYTTPWHTVRCVIDFRDMQNHS